MKHYDNPPSLNPINLSDPKGEVERRITNVTTTPLIRPTAMVQLLDSMHLNQAPQVTTQVWKGEEMEIAIYKPSSPNYTEFRVAYPKGLQDTEAFKYASWLYGYANDIGARSDSTQPIVFNDFLDWLGYKRDKDNTHDINNKRRVWKALYTASRTYLRTQFGFLVKKSSRSKRVDTYVFDKPVIDTLVGVYTRNGKDIETKDYEETPPDKIVVKFVDFLVTQLQGKKLESGEWIPKDATLTPKIEAGLWRGKYQGSAMALLDYIFLQLKNSFPSNGIRNYTKTELLRRASNIKRQDMAVEKLIKLLDLFEQDKHIRTWGFRATIKAKQSAKQYRKYPYIWIDFNETDTLKKQAEFRKRPAGKSRLEKLERDMRLNKKRVAGLEKKNKEYGI